MAGKVRQLFADMTLDSMYKWKCTPTGKVAHMVPKRNTGLTPVSHCGRSASLWRDAPRGAVRCSRCAAAHVVLTHGGGQRGGRGGALH